MAGKAGKQGTILVLILLFFLLTLPLALAASRVFRVNEGDLVKVGVDASDADLDRVVYRYSAPLNLRGEWQTTFDDAGEYALQINASDGLQETIEEIILIVENVNQKPFLTEKKVTVKEKQRIDLRALVKDPDDDPLEYDFKAPFSSEGIWETTYDDAGEHLVLFTVSDGEFTENLRVGITVLDTKRPLTITRSFSDAESLSVREGEQVSFSVEVDEDHQEEALYRWTIDTKTVSELAQGTYDTGFESAGNHTMELQIIAGEENLTKRWKLEIENVNRKPSLILLPLTAKEGEKVQLELPQKDLDGDTLVYSFENPVESNGINHGEWQTDYDDAGKYKIDVTVSDGEFTVEETLVLTIVDTDRPPVLKAPLTIEAWEGEKVVVPLETYDPDEDDFSITFSSLPEGARYNESAQTLTITASYDTVKRRGGMLSNILNTLRIEQFFLRPFSQTFTITSCGKDLCTSADVTMVVRNTNRAPQLDVPAVISVKETEEVLILVDAVDPDADIVRTYFTSPLSKKSGTWSTNNDDEGEYQIYVTATDGKSGTTVPVTLKVTKNNRAPQLSIRDDDIRVNEGQQFLLRLEGDDADGDALTLGIEDIPEDASFQEGEFLWTVPFETVNTSTPAFWSSLLQRFPTLNKRLSPHKAVVWLRFSADDADATTLHPVKVTVANVNRAPEMVDYSPVKEIVVNAGEPVLFHVAAKDPDGDELHYAWDFGLAQEEVIGVDTVRRTFTSAGTKEVSVVVDDGQYAVEKEWVVQVNVPSSAKPIVAPKPLEKPTVKVYVIKG